MKYSFFSGGAAGAFLGDASLPGRASPEPLASGPCFAPGCSAAALVAPGRSRCRGCKRLAAAQAFCLGLLLILLSACDLFGGDEPDLDTSVLMPLALGNAWTYQSTYAETIIDSFTVEITRALEVEHEEHTYRAFGQIFRPNAVPEHPSYAWLYSNGPEGLYTMGGVAETDTFAVRCLYRKYPGRVGEMWPMVRLVYRQSTTGEFAVLDSLETTLMATQEPFETPLGRFRCYVYRYTFRPADDVWEVWDVFEYYAPGIGMVGQVIWGRVDGQVTNEKQRVVLYDYRVQ